MTSGRPAERARDVLAARLRSRRSEIEQVALNRIYAISDPTEARDPAYTEGLRAALSAAVDYALAALERGEERAPPLPAALLAQARVAARNGVGLDTVLRRYFAGYSLFADFLIEETEDGDLLGSRDLQDLLRGQAALFDRLVSSVSDEYSREVQSRPGSTEQRRAERIERLLAGELIDTSGLAYDFERFHLGLVATGEGAGATVRELTGVLDCHLLSIRRDGGYICAWLGSRDRFDPCELMRRVSSRWPPHSALGIGEPGEGLAGWRLTHRQALAAISIALAGRERIVRYVDAALLASMLKDDLLATSLRQIYLAPLERERDRGAVAHQTLRAYFAAERNVSSTAAALGVTRRTVAHRLQMIESRLGCQLNARAAELEIALRLAEQQSSNSPATQSRLG
jgi:PucR-like helix-turn-helix protein/diguanylate cyclase with GGDEF domain